jgi:hypothetical protein
MSSVTYGDIKSYVQNRLDLRDEAFITPIELLQYTEEALKYCEAEVHKLNIEDQYFEAEHFIRLFNGKPDYNLPSNIYANKILRIVYQTASAAYDMSRISHRRRYVDSSNIDRYGDASGNDFRYRIVNNNPVDGTKVRFHPRPTFSTPAWGFTATTVNASATLTAVSSFTGLAIGQFVSGTGIRNGSRIEELNPGTSEIVLNQSANASGTAVSLTAVQDQVRVHYIRRVEIPVLDADPIDFPEFWNFIAQHVVVACLKKELGNPRIGIEDAYLKELRQQMSDTLADMVPDQLGDLIEFDMDHYTDSALGD